VLVDEDFDGDSDSDSDSNYDDAEENEEEINLSSKRSRERQHHSHSKENAKASKAVAQQAVLLDEDALEELTANATALARTALPTLDFGGDLRLILLTKIEEFIERGVMMSKDIIYSAALIAVGIFFLASSYNSSSLSSSSSFSSSSTLIDISSLEIIELQGYIRLALIHFTTGDGSEEMQASIANFQAVFNVPPETVKKTAKASAKDKEAAIARKASFQSGSGHFCVTKYCLRYLLPCGAQAAPLSTDEEGANDHAKDFATFFLHAPGLGKLYDTTVLQETYEAFLSRPTHTIPAVTPSKGFNEIKHKIPASLNKRLDIAKRFRDSMWESQAHLMKTSGKLEKVLLSIFLRKSFKSE
jgi:hypothetical protein